MPITTLPTPPARTDSPADFVSKADLFLAALPTFATEANAQAAAINAVATGPAAKAAYTWNATTTAGTSAGQIRFNNATQMSTGIVYLNETDSGAISAIGFCDFINSTSSTTSKGVLKVSEQATPSKYIFFRVTAHSDSGTERALTVTPMAASAASPITAVAVWVEFWPMGDIGTLASGVPLANTDITGIRRATFSITGVSTGATTGAISLDWRVSHMWHQAEPSGGIQYTFSNPGTEPFHGQIRIASDGSSNPQSFTFSPTVKWMGMVWTPASNKAAMLTFYWDGSNYYAMGVNEV